MVWYSHLFQNFPQFIATMKNICKFLNKLKIGLLYDSATLLLCIYPDEIKPYLEKILALSRSLQSIFHSHIMETTQVAAKSLQSCWTLCNPIDAAQQAPLSLGFSRQEHWTGLPFPSPMHESET